jgi:hypothetical protein
MDAINTSMCVWPLIAPPVYLKRLDVFENTAKLCHFGTTTVTESRKIRHSGDFTPSMSLMVLSNPTQLTHQLFLEKVTPPLRIRVQVPSLPIFHQFICSQFRTTGGKNRRDVTRFGLVSWLQLLSSHPSIFRWYLAETLDAFVGTTGTPGTIDYFVDWTDGPDRFSSFPLYYCERPLVGIYCLLLLILVLVGEGCHITAKTTSHFSCCRLWRFSAYPVTQYYILHREVDHPLLESEGGRGRTCNVVKGTQVFCRKRWK